MVPVGEPVGIRGSLSGSEAGRRPPTTQRAAARRIIPAEILGDGTMAGVIGASAIALFFLLIDTARREPLFTPSVMASVLLRGESPANAGVDLSMVAAYSMLHGAAFVAVGVLAALATAVRHASVATFTLAIALFATLELGFLATCIATDRSLLDAVGVAPATVGNLLAAIGMATYLHRWPHEAIEERDGHLHPEG